MLKDYFKRKSKFSIALDVVIGIAILLILIPGTRKGTLAFILKPTLFLHQPGVNSTKKPVAMETWNWQLEDMKGDQVSLSDYKGKVVFINLWATWCPPCIAELPDLQKLYNNYNDKVVFMFVSNEETEKIKSFLTKRGLNISAFSPLTQYPGDFETNSIPTTFVLNREGEIVISHKGLAKWNSRRIRGILDALTGNKKEI